jgi:hypothetical protein
LLARVRTNGAVAGAAEDADPCALATEAVVAVAVAVAPAGTPLAHPAEANDALRLSSVCWHPLERTFRAAGDEAAAL